MTNELAFILIDAPDIEVVGKIKQENDKSIVLDDALIIQYQVDNQGNAVGFFQKYSLYTNTYTVQFPKKSIRHVWREGDLVPKLVQRYHRAVKQYHKVSAGNMMEPLTPDIESDDRDHAVLEDILQELPTDGTKH